MTIPELDERSRQDILHRFRTLAAAYVPEWRFSEEDPDVGSVLAMLYGGMTDETIRRLNRLPDKHRTEFFRMLGIEQQPGLPAIGCVTMKLAGDRIEPEHVPAGTRLVADKPDADGVKPVFETDDDLLVTSASIPFRFTSCGELDRIVAESSHLFDLTGENLQRHALYIGHPVVLDLTAGAWIQLRIAFPENPEAAASAMAVLTDAQTGQWCYSTANGFEPFERVRSEAGAILLLKGERQPQISEMEIGGRVCRWIRFSTTDIRPASRIVFRSLSISSVASDLPAAVVDAPGTDVTGLSCLPFGERWTVYDSVHFGSEEALWKKGAEIELDFAMAFEKIPIDIPIPERMIDWKLIMKKSQLEEEKSWEIAIEEVLWEYYNGRGWARLFPDRRHSDLFRIADAPPVGVDDARFGTFRRVRLTFPCPADLVRVPAGPREGAFVRARILSIRNPYRIRGHYATPRIDDVRFSFSYAGRPERPAHVRMENGLAGSFAPSADLEGERMSLHPFIGIDHPLPMVHLGFDRHPGEGPVKLLIPISGRRDAALESLEWEYRSVNGWKPLNVIDGTDGFIRGGILTMMVPGDLAPFEVFGSRAWWIRAIDPKSACLPSRGFRPPAIGELRLNAVSATAARTEKERFTIPPQAVGHPCALKAGGIVDASVQVLEDGVWTNWERRTDFLASEPLDRHFVLDGPAGVIRFSNGRNGRIPPSGPEETILVSYRAGSGGAGNLPAGVRWLPEQNLGYVGDVSNPMPSAGGCDPESPELAIRRGTTALRHGARAVTSADFESLALEASRSVLRARCFTGVDASGMRRPGHLCLVVLRRGFDDGSDAFGAIRRQVLDRVMAATAGTLVASAGVDVIEPRFLELDVRVDVLVRSAERMVAVRRRILERLSAFLDPVTGGFDGMGWAIGSLPNRTQLANCLKDIPDVAFVRNVFVSAVSQDAGGRAEADPDSSATRLFALPVGGTHEVRILEEGRERHAAADFAG